MLGGSGLGSRALALTAITSLSPYGQALADTRQALIDSINGIIASHPTAAGTHNIISFNISGDQANYEWRGTEMLSSYYCRGTISLSDIAKVIISDDIVV